MTTHAPVGSGSQITSLPTVATGGATMTAGAAGVAGAYAEVDDGTGVPASTFKIVGISLDTPSAAMVGQVDIASGAAASEVILASVHFEIATDAGGYPPIYIPPSGPVAASTRLACRLTTVAGSHTLNATLMMQTV